MPSNDCLLDMTELWAGRFGGCDLERNVDTEIVKVVKLLVLAKSRSDHGSLWVEKRKEGWGCGRGVIQVMSTGEVEIHPRSPDLQGIKGMTERSVSDKYIMETSW